MTEPPSPERDPDAPPPGSVPPPQPHADPSAGYPPPGSVPPPQQQPGGYPPPGYPYGYPQSFPPPGYPSGEDRTWALVSHFGGAAGMFVSGFLGWVPPLIALVGKGNQSPAVRAHAVAALNFQLTWTIVAAIGYITLCIGVGIVILAIAWLIGVIFGIIAGVRALNGQLYRYPLSIPLIR